MAFCANDRRQWQTTISHTKGRAGTNAQRNEVNDSGGWRWRSARCPSWLSHCLLTGWTKEATAPENERGNNESLRCEERQRSGSYGVGAVPGEKSAKGQCPGVGPSINVGLHAITRGRGPRIGRDGNDDIRGAANNDRKSGCRHDDNNNCDGRPPSNQNPSIVDGACCQ